MRKLIEDEILKATTYDELPKSISNILTKTDYRQQAFNGELRWFRTGDLKYQCLSLFRATTQILVRC